MEATKKLTIHSLASLKKQKEKISVLTSYDYTTAWWIDQAGCDVVLVGDSASNIVCGNPTTLPITLDEMIFLAKGVARACKRALVVGDMPFGTCSGNPDKSLEAAIRMMKESGIDAVKIEGGTELLPDIQKIIHAGIPVMGHVGLRPQSIHQIGCYNVQARAEEEAAKLLSDAHALEKAGCFALVAEKIPAALGKQVAEELHIPIIGIGAGRYTDGQVLVLHDMLGLTQGFSPKFLRRYATMGDGLHTAVTHYVADVKSGDFPNEDEQY